MAHMKFSKDNDIFLKVDCVETVYENGISISDDSRLKGIKVWIVTQDYIKGRLSYLVENSETGERCGEFDWQARAQEFADQLNAGEVRVAQTDKGYFGRNSNG